MEDYLDPAFAPQCTQYQILVTTTASLPYQAAFQKVILIEDFPYRASIDALLDAVYLTNITCE